MTQPFSGKGSAIRFFILLPVLLVVSACDMLLGTDSSPGIPKDNPGINASLPAEFPANRNGNTQRITVAQRWNQSCPDNQACTPSPKGRLEYTYDTGRLDSVIERRSDASSNQVSYRQYFYSSTTRLDKVAVAKNSTSNFHTLHHYTYDDEDDPSDFKADPVNGYTANSNANKLRLEYICKKLNFDASDIDNIECTRDGRDPDDSDTIEYFQADEVIAYIYYANGYLYRKEFDVDNSGTIDHQKIYHYSSQQLLTRVDTDNHYDGVIDERYRYVRDNDNVLRAFLDNGFDVGRTRGTDITVSYRLGSSDEVTRECYFATDRLEKRVSGLWEEGNCTNSSRQKFHWDFTWENGSCWAGGLDDIDPEARAINYLCKE